MGDHAESIEIDYDPSVISYADLLEVFWQAHDPGSRPLSTQYMSAIFYHTEDQKRLAIGSMKREEAKTQRKIYTAIRPASRFYRAEDYHQKYYLRQRPDLMEVFRSIYPAGKDFVDSTAAARVNAYLAGQGSLAAPQVELNDLLPPGKSARLLNLLRGPDR